MNFGCALSSTFLPLPSFLLPSSLQDSSLPISGGTLSQAPSACANPRFPPEPVHPQHIPPRSPVPQSPALPHTHTHTPALARPPPSSPGSRRVPTSAAHLGEWSSPAALQDPAARNSDRGSAHPHGGGSRNLASSLSFRSHPFRSGGLERSQGGCFPQASPVWLALSIWLRKVC